MTIVKEQQKHIHSGLKVDQINSGNRRDFWAPTTTPETGQVISVNAGAINKNQSRTALA